MPLPPGDFVVDAHLDIGCHCQEQARDLVDPAGCRVPVMVTLPLLQQAGARLICATLFTPHEGRPEAQRRYNLHSQYELYRQWFEQYGSELRLIRTRRDLAQLALADAISVAGRKAYPIGVIQLMEGLDLLGGPAELATWHERGVRMASLTWNGANRFASGCFADGKGIKTLGFDLIKEFERLGVILDLAHLNDAGIADIFKHYKGPLCSSHSNSRAIARHERNLTDAQIGEIAARGGVIGLNLLAPLVLGGWSRGDAQPALSNAVRHVSHISRIAGAPHVGIGSDLDGGLTPDNTPEGIEQFTDLGLLAGELATTGWTGNDLAGFMGINWWRFFELNLPE